MGAERSRDVSGWTHAKSEIDLLFPQKSPQFSHGQEVTN